MPLLSRFMPHGSSRWGCRAGCLPRLMRSYPFGGISDPSSCRCLPATAINQEPWRRPHWRVVVDKRDAGSLAPLRSSIWIGCQVPRWRLAYPKRSIERLEQGVLAERLEQAFRSPPCEQARTKCLVVVSGDEDNRNP